MVGVILLQQGKGVGMGASFGRGAQGGLYDTASKANFLTRTTSALATLFLLSSLALSFYLGESGKGVLEELQSGQPAIEVPEAVEELTPKEPVAPVAPE